MLLYEILGVPSDASFEKIKNAYHAKISRMDDRGIRGWLLSAIDAAYPYRYAYAILSDVSTHAA